MMRVFRPSFTHTSSYLRQSFRPFSSSFDVYPGAVSAKITDKLEFVSNSSVSPIYRVLNSDGSFLRPDYQLPLSEETLLQVYETMVLTHTTDTIMFEAQRQGRMSFYMMNRGEEAAQVGSSLALKQDDVIFGQYRELGALLWRGLDLEQLTNQCFSNEYDLGKGRQMPVHYGSRELNIQTISSPLGTQLPQAAGAAYALKLEGKARCVTCYFGDGAASEGDFHAAMNFASTLKCPVLFFCRNNGIAISTPTTEQYNGDGVSGLAQGYGMKNIRVDGNDVLAVYEATRLARAMAVEENVPVFVEAMSFRGGNHSTSDDSTRYRSVEEMKHWFEHNNPITRFRTFLLGRGLWSGDKEAHLQVSTRQSVLKALKRAENASKPHLDEMFSDVYESLTPALQEQKEKLERHLKEFGHEYPLSRFKS